MSRRAVVWWLLVAGVSGAAWVCLVLALSQVFHLGLSGLPGGLP